MCLCISVHACRCVYVSIRGKGDFRQSIISWSSWEEEWWSGSETGRWVQGRVCSHSVLKNMVLTLKIIRTSPKESVDRTRSDLLVWEGREDGLSEGVWKDRAPAKQASWSEGVSRGVSRENGKERTVPRISRMALLLSLLTDGENWGTKPSCVL